MLNFAVLIILVVNAIVLAAVYVLPCMSCGGCKDDNSSLQPGCYTVQGTDRYLGIGVTLVVGVLVGIRFLYTE